MTIKHPITGKEITICAEPRTDLQFGMPARSCSGHDLILVSGGCQCMNCGNLRGRGNVVVKPEKR